MKKMKKALVFLLVLTLLLSNGAMAFAEGPSGSATATAQGLEETVTVTVTVEDGVIAAVEAVTDKEDETVGRQALTDLPLAMVEQNSVKVDAVSGATSTSTAVISAATAAYLEILGADLDLDAWAKGQGYVKGEDFYMVTGVDAITSATVSGKGGINFGDIDLSDELKKELILEYLKGAEGNYREMYQIATSYNNVPTIGSVEYVLDPADMSLFGSSETNTAKLNNMNDNPQVDLYWTRQIRAGDICSEALPVLPSYFMSYGVQFTGTYKAIHFAELSEEEIPVYVAKAHYYFETLDTTAQLAAMDDEALYAYLCQSPMNFYQIVPTRIVVTSPWFLNVYDTGYARQFVSEEMQAKLAAAAAEVYPDAQGLTVLDFATFSATGLKTQQVLTFGD
ncbi:MAG: FMN-binding protein [Oscillospiraceae bacterium]|nr:FMN-binding protein [Oscillospiraceae bacterium]